METIRLSLGGDACDIHIGAGLLHRAALLGEKLAGSQVFILSNPTVAEHYLQPLKTALLASAAGLRIDSYLMPDGEAYKTLETLNVMIGEMLSCGHHRTTTVIALGGGVVGDIAGFAAACYQRGVNFLQIPTTLLSQVDASVGGKTAVNHPLGKNMIGAFHQPRAVYIDTDTLSTLPGREFSAGLAEVIKHGVLADAEYLDWVEQHLDALRSLDTDRLTTAIKGSCEIKAAIVAEDEREAGKRALLNYGHTFGHAIETGLGHGDWLHGEAVGAGMVMATDLSWRLGRCSADDARRIKALIARAGLPVCPPASISMPQFLALMAKDKKATDSGLRFVLLDGTPGASELVSEVPVAKIKETLAAGAALCEGGL